MEMPEIRPTPVTDEASEEERQMEVEEVPAGCGSHKPNGDSGFMYLLMWLVPWQ